MKYKLEDFLNFGIKAICFSLICFNNLDMPKFEFNVMMFLILIVWALWDIYWLLKVKFTNSKSK